MRVGPLPLFSARRGVRLRPEVLLTKFDRADFPALAARVLREVPSQRLTNSRVDCCLGHLDGREAVACGARFLEVEIARLSVRTRPAARIQAFAISKSGAQKTGARPFLARKTGPASAMDTGFRRCQPTERFPLKTGLCTPPSPRARCLSPRTGRGTCQQLADPHRSG